VVLTAERLQETLDDTVRRGRITRDDAERLLQDLLTIGRKQTEDVLTEVEQLVRMGPGGMADAARQAGERARTRVQRHESADRVLREVDRARRAAGIGPAFPITGYDALSASQVAARLDDLSSAELRKVRDHERRHQARKSVIGAIEKRLAH
jgi:polyhydroxyalkanoate synthesis regulator phasin